MAVRPDHEGNVELVLPGEVAAQVDLAVSAFTDFLAVPLPDAVAAAARSATAAGLSLVVHIAGADITRVALLIPEVGGEVVARLCAAVGVEYKNEVHQLQGMLGAEEILSLEYRQHKGAAAGVVDVHLVPGLTERVPNMSRN